MKNKLYLIVMILLSFSLSACFTDDESHVKLTIIKNSFSGQFVHVGAFFNDEVIAQVSFANTAGVDIAPFYVPSNENITFVILGEENGKITYHGEKDVPVNGDNNQIVVLSMLNILNSYGDSEGGIDIAKDGNLLSWHDFTGADEYELKYDNGSSFDLFYTGSDEFVETPYTSGAADEHYLTIRFGFVDRETYSYYGTGF